jgi:hypothetical protein
VHHLVVAALSVLPTPFDYLTARAELSAAAGTPPVVTHPTSRIRFALVALMLRVGACDPGREYLWFGSADYAAEVDRARAVWARVQTCPHLWEGEGWVPSQAYLTARSWYWDRRHKFYLEWYLWEPDRFDVRDAAAVAFELSWALWLVAQPDGCDYPRRVMLGRLRAAIGAEAWDRQELPPGW